MMTPGTFTARQLYQDQLDLVDLVEETWVRVGDPTQAFEEVRTNLRAELSGAVADGDADVRWIPVRPTPQIDEQPGVDEELTVLTWDELDALEKTIARVRERKHQIAAASTTGA